jgi:hypothetical protein
LKLSVRHAPKHQQHAPLPLLWQGVPDKRTWGFAHRGIQANAPRRTALEHRFSALRCLPSTYQRQPQWCIEGAFRDTKDLRFGMGMGAMHVSTPDRRDRLWLINAFAVVLLTLLGTAGEALGYDRHLKSNTTKRRTHSLFRQGSMLYELIPTMPEYRLQPLVEQFARMLAAQPVFREMFGAV